MSEDIAIGVLHPMNLSSTKYDILKTMFWQDSPLRAAQAAKEIEKEFPSVMMHIIGLNRLGYINSPEKGQYAITEKGKKALGIPEINAENAKTILAYLPDDKSFQFYASIGNPLRLHAHGLQDFRDKILKINVDSVEFHMSRGDFEAWFEGLGDIELAKKAALLKEREIGGDELRRKLHDIVVNRFIALARIAGHIISPT